MMKNVARRCTKCALSASFPNIRFDREGVCNICREEIYYATEDTSITKARARMLEIIASTKGKSEYDAIMCYSGGKDSTYTLILAVRKYGLKVLSFTLDNGFMSPAAFENINRVVDSLGVDQCTIRVSSAFFNALARASAVSPIYNPKTLTRISSVCNSCISLVNMTALKIALEKRIGIILAGFTLGQIPVNSIIFKNNYRFLQDTRQPVLNKLRNLIGGRVDDYFTLSESLLSRTDTFPFSMNLLCIEDLSEKEILDQIRPLGWINPSDVDGCSSNCRLNGFNNLIHTASFGFNPYELELSQQVRRGTLTREEAIEKISKQLPPPDLEWIINRLDIKKEDIDALPYPAC